MITQPIDDCWFLTGATAVGKTKIGIALAQCLDAEILSLDSMAIYRGMNIGTAKPTLEEQALVPHHLIDLIDPDQSYNIAQYLEAAHAKRHDIRTRNRITLFVGGTPLYLKGLLRGLFEGPPANWQVRANIEQELDQMETENGSRVLHSRLEKVDPVAASQIHPHDTRRLIRALEVYRITGQPISHQQLQFDDGRPANQCRVFVLQRSPNEGRQRIETRVDAMITRGLIDEVKQLTRSKQPLGRTARQAVGYREVLDYLAGQLDLDVMIEKIKSRTRRFAKRQRTWFRSLSECTFVDIDEKSNAEEIVSQIVVAGEQVRDGR
jgi:tRNA dimethylallyltransferase